MIHRPSKPEIPAAGSVRIPPADVVIRKFKDLDLQGATVINGYPSGSLINAVVANYLIAHLKLDQIACLDSPHFPPISMVYDRRPKFPARVYGSEHSKLAVFLSEFTPAPSLARPLAMLMLEWARAERCSQILSPEVFPRELLIAAGEPGELYAVASTDSARNRLESVGLAQLDHGMVPYISGILLNEGRWQNFDVFVFIAATTEEEPIPRTAARLIGAIDQLLPGLAIDVEPLLRDAKLIEQRVVKLREQARLSERKPEDERGYV